MVVLYKNLHLLKRVLPALLLMGIMNQASAQCPAITCPGNMTVSNDPNTCGAIVNFVAPVGTNPCGAPQTFNYTGSMQHYTVPVGITTLTITAKGAQGGNNGGLGAIMQGTVSVTPGDILNILVGGQGLTNFTVCGTWFGAGGGGGSFVTTGSNTPLLIAGGGGGNICVPNIGMDAVTTNDGVDGYSPAYPTYYGIGGVGGNGASNGPNPPHAGNGGGFNTTGATGLCGSPGQGFLQGGAGGLGCGANPAINGGYGGGGGGGNAGGGGGGGYGGGGGSYHFPGNGGGGGSYNSGTNQNNSVGNTGNGVVEIAGGTATTTLIAGLPPGSTFPIGNTTETYQVDDGLGNYATCSFTITVTDTSHPIVQCPANVYVCNNIVNNIAPIVNNAACPVVTYTLSGATTGSGTNDASGTYFNPGTTNVMYKVVSANGNADSCTFTVDVTYGSAPTIVIDATPGDTGCTGQPVVFNTTITSGGPSPAYQWIKNNTVVGSNSSSYTDAGLVTGDVIYCVLTSNDPCVPVTIDTSNSITMTMIPPVTPTLMTVPDPDSNICEGSPVNFTAVATNAGNSPTYQWLLNNVPVGSNQNTYTAQNLVTGDVIKCVMTSDAVCAIPQSVTSNTVTMSTFTASPYLSGSLGNTISKNYFVTGYIKNVIRDNNCDLMVTIEPQWQDPVYGSTDVRVTIDPDIQTYNGQPYLQRHFDIEPANNASTATGFVTLYAYQSEFDAYNAVADTLGLPLMPTDFIYTGNIRVTQFHGTGTEPGNYSAGTYTIINPAVSWDTAHHWWQMVFPVTGFSGFYIHTGNFPLNLKQVQPEDFTVMAFPNPVKDKVTLQVFGKQAANSRFAITDIAGRTIMDVPMTNDKAIADISSLAQGMYLVKYSDDERTQTIKITKQ